jgi:hypothetical protein
LWKAPITIAGSGRKSIFRIVVNVDLPDGFIWKKGGVGQGSFRASAAGVSLAFDKTS